MPYVCVCTFIDCNRITKNILIQMICNKIRRNEKEHITALNIEQQLRSRVTTKWNNTINFFVNRRHLLLRKLVEHNVQTRTTHNLYYLLLDDLNILVKKII